MSHFKVAVIHSDDQTAEDMLEPYIEEVDSDSEYAEFEIEVKNGEEKQKQDEELSEDYWQKSENKENLEKYSKMEPAEFVEEYYGYLKNDNGDWGYWRNPNAKWDWYQIGGRWAGQLKLKNGKTGKCGEKSLLLKENPYKEGYADSAKIEDIDFIGMEKEECFDLVKGYYASVEKRKQLEIEGKTEEEIQKEMCWKFAEVNKDETIGDYLNRKVGFSSFAVLDDDGWHERAEMGWWGIERNEKEPKEKWESNFYDRFLKGRENLNLTIVDCHT